VRLGAGEADAELGLEALADFRRQAIDGSLSDNIRARPTGDAKDSSGGE
jgi:hypothetical protein